MHWTAAEAAKRVRHIQGFALTEVLVAAALLAVGLLGQLALLVTGLQTERAAADLATAATLAADLGERIRANRFAGPAYAFEPDPGSTPTTDVCAVATPFDAAARATCDLGEWHREVARALPGAQAQVVTSTSVGSAVLYIITIQWSAPGQQAAACSLQVQT